MSEINKQYQKNLKNKQFKLSPGGANSRIIIIDENMMIPKTINLLS